MKEMSNTSALSTLEKKKIFAHYTAILVMLYIHVTVHRNRFLFK